jgi:hypothetical protein
MDTSTPLPPAASAWYDWFDSEEGVRCSDITTLRAPHGDPRHLEDRLHAAFVAGHRTASAAEEAAPELLEALRLLCDLNPSQHHIDEVARRHAIARAVIARATAPTPTTESHD